ncbi:hypothetical protein FG167_06285 [Lacinutrix sp. WUR7]|uniref:hypothetical protein n=1 Tax=Lacinutrix sp. WUR7 TaxID=2653681 RepID=UPI00193E8479|nr:hypothetical protein [Lacinutrix sp. WUR7]QRM88856.1 hypothetical protein FG167_06285 [Lacinutrix sp. WUR7]
MKKNPTYNMKHISTLLIFLMALNAFSQDIITTNNGEEIEAKVEEVGTEKIKYKKQENLDGPDYFIEKNKVSKIVFNNGSVDTFSNLEIPEYSLEKTKEIILEYINKYGFEEDNFKQRYIATFEGDYLRLIFTNRKGTKPANNGFLYDFSNVYRFDKISKRSDKLSYINIWTSIMVNEKKKKWDKHKLIMRVESYQNGQTILNALKHYNKLLLDKGEESFKKLF